MFKKYISFGLVVFMILSVFGLVACNKNEHENARKRIKEITEIEVPEDSKILYHHIDRTFVNGRRAQYTVFEFENEPVDWLKENAFLEGRDENNEYYFLDNFDFMTIKTEEIPNEYIPNFEKTHLWIRTQRVHFFFFLEKLMLMVLIAGS